MSEGLRYIPACVTEATCEPTSTAYTESSQQLATSATLKEQNAFRNSFGIKQHFTCVRNLLEILM